MASLYEERLIDTIIFILRFFNVYLRSFAQLKALSCFYMDMTIGKCLNYVTTRKA